jgi:4a-hydroxytetrahydrobiopterin dehydratase
MTNKHLPTEINDQIKALNLWQIKNGKLYRKITFKNFIEAFSFMTHIAIYAEKENHHPEWKNVYNQIEIWLTTHDKNAITEKDIDLAKKIDEYKS